MNIEQGFVAGTLVHTDKGLAPIEQIKVGDRVLSKPENDEGELAYKPVVNTFEFEDKKILFLEVSTIFTEGQSHITSEKIKFSQDILIATPNHPFWVVGKLNTAERLLPTPPKITIFLKPYWSQLEKLEIGTVILRHDGALVGVDSVQPVFVMKDDHLGFIQGYLLENWWNEESGSYIDFNSNPPKLYEKEYYTFFNNEALFYPNDGEWDYPIKTRKVYNLEVADYHTYFVGESGIWVKSA